MANTPTPEFTPEGLLQSLENELEALKAFIKKAEEQLKMDNTKKNNEKNNEKDAVNVVAQQELKKVQEELNNRKTGLLNTFSKTDNNAIKFTPQQQTRLKAAHNEFKQLESKTIPEFLKNLSKDLTAANAAIFVVAANNKQLGLVNIQANKVTPIIINNKGQLTTSSNLIVQNGATKSKNPKAQQRLLQKLLQKFIIEFNKNKKMQLGITPNKQQNQQQPTPLLDCALNITDLVNPQPMSKTFPPKPTPESTETKEQKKQFEENANNLVEKFCSTLGNVYEQITLSPEQLKILEKEKDTLYESFTGKPGDEKAVNDFFGLNNSNNNHVINKVVKDLLSSIGLIDAPKPQPTTTLKKEQEETNTKKSSLLDPFNMNLTPEEK